LCKATWTSSIPRIIAGQEDEGSDQLDAVISLTQQTSKDDIVLLQYYLLFIYSYYIIIIQKIRIDPQSGSGFLEENFFLKMSKKSFMGGDV